MPRGAANFFTSTVKPTAEEFLNNIRDIRRGRLAAIVLYHMSDYWALENETTVKSLKILNKELIEECPDFLLIRDVANASKHARLTSTPEPPRELSSSEQITRTPGIFGAPFNTAVFNEASIVMVTLDDGTSHPLAGAVRSVLFMWEKKLFS